MTSLFHTWQQLGYGPFWPVVTLALLATLVGLGTYSMVLTGQYSRNADKHLRNH